MVDVSVPCGSCGKPLRGGDDFCESCGAKVTDELKQALRGRLEASDSSYAGHTKEVRSAQSTIAVLAVLFTIGGAVMFFMTRSTNEKALGQLSGAADGDPLVQVIEGASTVGELRALLEQEPYQVLGLNLFLAVVMLGLWFWSKRSLLPAIITAAGIYITVMLASALYDPKTLAQGIIVKIIVIIALIKGIKAALAARKLETAR